MNTNTSVNGTSARDVINPMSLVQVYSVTSPGTAEVIRTTLGSHGIPCWIEGRSQAGLAGILLIGLLVRARDADRAWRIIQTFGN